MPGGLRHQTTRHILRAMASKQAAVELSEEDRAPRKRVSTGKLQRSRAAARHRPYLRATDRSPDPGSSDALLDDDDRASEQDGEPDIPLAAGTAVVRVHELDDVPIPQDVVGRGTGAARLTRAKKLRPAVRAFANPRPASQQGREDPRTDPVKAVTVAPDGRSLDAAWDPGSRNTLRVPFDALALGLRFVVVDASGMGRKGAASASLAAADLDIASCLRHGLDGPWRRRLLLLDEEGGDCGSITVAVHCQDTVFGDHAKRATVQNRAPADSAPKPSPRGSSAAGQAGRRTGRSPDLERKEEDEDEGEDDEDDLLQFTCPPPPPPPQTRPRVPATDRQRPATRGGEEEEDPWAGMGAAGGDEALPDPGPETAGVGVPPRPRPRSAAQQQQQQQQPQPHPPGPRWSASVPREQRPGRGSSGTRTGRVAAASTPRPASGMGSTTASFMLSAEEARVTKGALQTLSRAADEERRAKRWHEAQRREVTRRARKEWDQLQRERRERQREREEVEAALLEQQAEALVEYDRKITRARRARELAVEKRLARPLAGFRKSLKGPYFGDGPPPAEPWSPPWQPATVTWDQNGRRRRVAANDMPSAGGADPASQVIAHIRRTAAGGGRMDLRRPFARWDADGSGSLTRREFSQALGSLGVRLEQQELDHIVRAFDTDGDGTVSYGEFLFAVFNRRKLRAQWGERMRALEDMGQDAARAAGAAVTAGAREAAAESGAGSGADHVRRLLRSKDESGKGLVHRRKVARVLREVELEMPEWQLQTLMDRYAGPGGSVVDYSGLVDFLEGTGADANDAWHDQLDAAEEAEAADAAAGTGEGRQSDTGGKRSGPGGERGEELANTMRYIEDAVARADTLRSAVTGARVQ